MDNENVTVHIRHTTVISSGCSHDGVIKRVSSVQLRIGEHWVAGPSRPVTPIVVCLTGRDASPENLRMR